MRKLLQTLFFFLLLTQICFAQLERLSHPLFYEPDRSDYPLKPAIMDSTQLDSIINATMSVHNIPGLSALIIKKESGIVWKRNYGYANVAQNKAVEDTTLFLLASISKTILATAVMQFWEADSFDLDDPINDYLEGFQVFNPYYPSDIITIRMLMTHTSSISDRWPWLHNFTYCGDNPMMLDSFLINYLTPGGSYYNPNLNFYNKAPGAEWQYSNVASSILALLVERFSDMSFNQYCRENIFDPLEMHRSSFLIAELDTNNIATPYLWNGSQYVPYCHQGHILCPAGFLRSNKIELQKFLSTYMNWGKYNGNTILDSSTVALMLSDQLGYPVPGYGDYQGLIWYQSGELNGRFPWGHQGSFNGGKTGMFFKQEEDWGIICLMNSEESDATLIYLLNKLCDYAHLYGNIYALNPTVNKSYAQVNVDSVLFRTRFSNIHNHPFTPHLIYVNTDSTLIDSLTLFDDGLHGDSLANDGIYGGYIPKQQSENFYYLGVSTIDHETNKYFSTPDISRFTTAGPVVLDSISYSKGSSNFFNIKVYVFNQGVSKTITDASVRLICNDNWISTLTPQVLNLPEIPPGETVSPTSQFRAYYIDSLFPGYFNFKVEVMSDRWIYWTDSMQVVVTGIESEEISPTEFVLEQNYPNPFNPTTTFKYSIPQTSKVVIKVYDILGNEIELLIDEEKTVGTYELTWNAASLPSGVYFYQLKAGEYVNTKKMILLK
jgi:CubicO group peptidase (beta-lactamase class C family)